MNTHNTTLMNGNYASDIGTTTLKAFCNDNDGFAIYAIGYTDDTDGKTVMTSSTLDSTYDIATGTGTSGNSQWAMKLATQTTPEPTYPITIENNYNNYHTVPDDYELVAKRTSATDVGDQAIGSVLTSTYQVYVSTTQPAGTYIGQVKYVLVHPNYVNNDALEGAVTVIFNGDESYFPGGGTTNTVKYASVCEPGDYVYIGNTPTISKTINIADDGTMNTYNTSNDVVEDTVTIPGADRLKVELTYGYDDNGGMEVYYNGNSTTGQLYGYFWSEDWEHNNEKTTKTSFIIESNTITFITTRWGEPTVNYYGYYAKVYPVYNTEQPNTAGENLPTDNCSVMPISGSYIETTNWKNNNYWLAEIEDGWKQMFYNENEIKEFIKDYEDSLRGRTITLYSHYPYTVYFDGNNATAGTMDGFTISIDDSTVDNRAYLIPPNYYKTGYGFAGWSQDRNATVNSNSTIYGPNEIITGDELIFDNEHEATLYAVWVSSSGNMQNYSCNNLTSGQITALTDTRDGNVYTVGKMQDGNCWMMENLRLNAANSSDSTKAQGFGGAFTGLADSEDKNFDYFGSTVANSKYDGSIITGTNSQHRFPRYNNNNTNIGGTNSNGTTLVPLPSCNDDSQGHCTNDRSDHAQWYSYGNYYNWAATIANTNNFTQVAASESANTSICPSGWFLPYGRKTGAGIASGGFAYLDAQIGGSINSWLSYPNNFIISGEWMSADSSERGSFSVYWSRTVSSSAQAWGLGIGYDRYFIDTYQKANGNVIRCIIISN